MPVEFQVDSLDTVDESIRGAYVENEGKFNFDPDKYAEIKAQGLKSKNKELLGKLTNANDGLKKFEKFAELEDDDLTELLELREQKKNPPPPADPNKGKGTGDLTEYDKALKKVKDAAAAKESELQTRLDDATKQIKHFKLTVPLREIALKEGVLPEDLNVVMLETAGRFTLDEQDKIVVLDEDGDATDITPQKFFGTLYKEQRPKFYAASGASGSGAPSATAKGNGGQKIMKRSEFDALDQASRAAKVKEGFTVE